MEQQDTGGDGGSGHPTLNPTPRLIAAPHTMDTELKPWELYILDGAEETESLESMKQYFTRYRATRNKATNNSYTHDALQRSWCAFIKRWNATRREGTSFTSWLEAREERRGEHSIGELRTRLCNDASSAWRICYVHLREGCSTCGENSERLARAAWNDEVRRYPLDEDTRRWIGRYERSLSELEQARLRHERGRSRGRGHRRSRSQSRGGSRSRSRGRERYDPPQDAQYSRGRPRSRSRDRHDGRGQQRNPRSLSPMRARPRSPSPRREYPPSSGCGAPMYPPLANIPASGPGNASQQWGSVYSWTGDQASGEYACRDRRCVQQSSVGHPTHRQVGADHRDGRVDCGGEATLQSQRSGGAPVSSVSRTDRASRVALPEDHPERLSIAQYNMMVAEAQQARDDALDAYRLAEDARDDARAATASAQQAQSGHRDVMERLRRLETARFGHPQRSLSARERQGLGPSRRQRRQRGTSDYEPARGHAGGDRGSPPGGTA